MSEKKPGIVKRSFKSLFDIRRWIAWDDIVSSWKGIISLVKDISNMPKTKPTNETFAEAAKRLNLTEEEIESRMRVHLHLTIAYLLICIALFIYLIYLV